MERDSRFIALALYYTNFNSHAHVERDFPRLAEWIEQGNFNSHAHVERDVRERWLPTSKRIFQLTRSRGAWHEPVVYKSLKSIFQLTRSRGAWRSQKWVDLLTILFQLTRSRGAWPEYLIYKEQMSDISTHTLTWSVTRGAMYIQQYTKDFNSHAHVERDLVFGWTYKG